MDNNDIQKFKDKLNVDIYNELHSDIDNIALRDQFYISFNEIKQALEEYWSSKYGENFLVTFLTQQFTKEECCSSEDYALYQKLDDLSRDLASDAKIVLHRFYHSKGSGQLDFFIKDDYLDEYRRKLDRICKLLENTSAVEYLDKEMKRYKIVAAKLERQTQSYITSSQFICLKCGYQNLFFASEWCPYEASLLGDVDSYRPTAKDRIYATESIEIGCEILRTIHKLDFFYKDDVEKHNDELYKTVEDYLSKNREKYKVLKLNDWVNGWQGENGNHSYKDLVEFYKTSYYSSKNRNRFIKEIKVKDLFGHHSYSLNISDATDLQSELDVIIGTNALGKTTVLNLLEFVLIHPSASRLKKKAALQKEYKRFQDILAIPFSEFSVTLTNEAGIILKKEMAEEKGEYPYEFVFKMTPIGGKISDPICISRRFKFKYNDVNDSLNNNQTIEFEDFSALAQEFCLFTNMVFNGFNLPNNFLFIRSNRVNNMEWSDSVNMLFNPKNHRAIRHMGIGNPLELIDHPFETELRKRYLAINIKSDKQVENISFAHFEFLKKWEEFCRYFSSVYYYSDPSKKTPILHSDGHLFFKVDKTGVELPFSSLSTGEQNIAVILYYIIFSVARDCLVFIDEPEISLHIAWQQQLVLIIQEIISRENYKGMQVILTTHSPHIAAACNNAVIEARLLDVEN